MNFGPDQNDLDPTKTNWASKKIGTQPKWFGRSKIILDPQKYKALEIKPCGLGSRIRVIEAEPNLELKC